MPSLWRVTAIEQGSYEQSCRQPNRVLRAIYLSEVVQSVGSNSRYGHTLAFTSKIPRMAAVYHKHPNLDFPSRVIAISKL